MIDQFAQHREELRLRKVRKLAALTIARELQEFPWDQLDPAIARKIHAMLPDTVEKALLKRPSGPANLLFWPNVATR